MNRGKLKIILAKSKDAEGIYQVRKITWINTYPNEKLGITKKDILERFIEIEKNFETYLDQRKEALKNQSFNSQTWIAKINKQVIGFCTAKRVKKNEIGAIYILPQFQGKGIGKKLMKKALKWLEKNKDIYVNVVSYNQKAINFYQSFGFIKTGKIVKEEIHDLPCGKTLPEIEMMLKR
ncbi:MAG: GNAT family N-acetyltransferase [Patescibacteria group bacterium]|nr:GNAT family N-acetyltransferase [Patescibacteria group bacterium]